MATLRPIDIALREATERGMDQNEFASFLGVTASVITNWKARGLPASRYKEVADAFGWSIDRLVRNTDSAPQPVTYAGYTKRLRPIVVAGMAKLGEDGFYDEISSSPGAGDGHVSHYSEDENAYALKVKGSSMTPAIRDGWYVIIEPNGRPTVGEYVLVKLKSGKKMVKELLFIKSDTITVMSVNGGDRMTLDKEEVDGLQPVSAVIPPSKWQPE